MLKNRKEESLMFLKIIVRDDVKRIGKITTDDFLDAIDAIFYSPIYKIDKESEIENIINVFAASCTKVRKPMVQVILGQTLEDNNYEYK